MSVREKCAWVYPVAIGYSVLLAFAIAQIVKHSARIHFGCRED